MVVDCGLGSLSKQYVVSGVGQKDEYWLTAAGRHWAEQARLEHARQSGQPVDLEPDELLRSPTAARGRGFAASDRGANAERYRAVVGAGGFAVDASEEESLLILRADCPSETSKRKKNYSVVVKLRKVDGQIDSSRCECKDSQKPQNRGEVECGVFCGLYCALSWVHWMAVELGLCYGFSTLDSYCGFY